MAITGTEVDSLVQTEGRARDKRQPHLIGSLKRMIVEILERPFQRARASIQTIDIAILRCHHYVGGGCGRRCDEGGCRNDGTVGAKGPEHGAD